MKQDIDAIENVQKFALHVYLKSWDCSYDQLLIQASLLSMQERRNFTSLCHLYKIFKGMTHFPDPPLEQHTSSYNTRSTSSITFSVPRFRTNGYKFSFFPRAIKLWNAYGGQNLCHYHVHSCHVTLYHVHSYHAYFVVIPYLICVT